jgi:transposase-like protein
MRLSADQRAMLQLVLERGQSYDDIASVLGVGVDEVRTRARAALTELGGADPDAKVGLTDYLLGQADPIGRADAVRELQSDPESRRLATELVVRLRELAPDARLPELPVPRERRGVLGRRRAPEPQAAEAADGAAAAPPPSPRRSRLRDTLSRRQQQAIVALAASAVIVIAAVLALSGAFGGGDDSEPATETTTAAGEEVLETVALRPQRGGQGSGEARFGLATQDQPFVELDLQGLDAPAEGETYVVWLLLSANQGYPLSPLQVGPEGSFSDRFPIPQNVIPLIPRTRFVDISLSQNRSLLSEIEKAVRDVRPILRYQGESVLRGEIPVAARGGGGGGSGGQP